MKTRKLIDIIGGAVAIAAVAGVAINNANSAPKMSDLMIKNLEVLSQNESILDYQIYYVYAYSSSHWTCTPGGSSACPAP
jgi:hypothetical protein